LRLTLKKFEYQSIPHMINRRFLNYSVVGDANNQTPVLILHGLFGSLTNWGSIAKKLAQKHTVITVDLRNHGHSPHTATMSYPKMAADIIQLLDQLDHPSAILVGHSMGGKVAMSCALENPDRIKALCVADIAPVSYQHEFDQIISALQSLPLDKINNRTEADQFLARTIELPMLRQFLLQNLIKEDGLFFWRLNLNAIKQEMPVITRFPEYSAGTVFEKETLFLCGANSNYVVSQYHPVIKKYFPAAVIQTLPDCAHWLQVEQPDLFYHSLIEFLDENVN